VAGGAALFDSPRGENSPCRGPAVIIERKQGNNENIFCAFTHGSLDTCGESTNTKFSKLKSLGDLLLDKGRLLVQTLLQASSFIFR